MDQRVEAIIKLSVRLTMGTLMEARLLRVHGRWQRSAHEAQYGVEQVKSVFLTQKNQRLSRVTKCNEGRPYLASKNSLTSVKLYSCDSEAMTRRMRPTEERGAGTGKTSWASSSDVGLQRGGSLCLFETITWNH